MVPINLRSNKPLFILPTIQAMELCIKKRTSGDVLNGEKTIHHCIIDYVRLLGGHSRVDDDRAVNTNVFRFYFSHDVDALMEGCGVFVDVHLERCVCLRSFHLELYSLLVLMVTLKSLVPNVCLSTDSLVVHLQESSTLEALKHPHRYPVDLGRIAKEIAEMSTQARICVIFTIN